MSTATDRVDTARGAEWASRAGAVLRLEITVQARYRVFAVLAAVSLATGTLMAALAGARPDAAAAATPFVLLVDTATVGTMVAAALLLAGRSEGALPALVVTPPGTTGLVLARVAVLLGATLAAAVPVALPALLRTRGLGGLVAGLSTVLAGTGLVAALLMLPSAAVAARSRSLTAFLVAVPALLTPLLVVPLIYGTGLLTHPLLQLMPTVPAFDLMRAGVGSSAGPTGGALAWAVALTVVAGHVGVTAADRWLREGPPPDRARARRAHGRVAGRRHRLLAFAVTDLRLVRRDAVLAVVMVSPLLLGAALRWGYPPLESWVAARYGLDLAPHRPLLAVLLVVLHVPFTAGMVGALLVLDDRDDRVLIALQVSPLTMERYLAYRLLTVTLAAGVGLAVAVPLSGLVPDGAAAAPLVAALALASLIAPVVTLSLTAFAGSRVEGVLAVKALGVPLYLPVLLGHLSGPAAAVGLGVLGWLPSTWVALAFGAATVDPPAAARSWTAAGVGLVVTGVVSVWLARRTLRRADQP